MKKKYNTTLKNIAEQTGTSVTTVSRVLNNKSEHYRISEKTGNKILQVAKKLNYSPNQLARSLRLKHTNTIGYIVPDISNPFFSSIAKSLERSVRTSGYSVILCDSEENTEIEIKSLKLLLDRKVDGLIISPVGQEVKHIAQAYKKNIPIVLIDRFFDELKIPYVGSDNYHGAYEAVNLFINNGHKRIACIQGLKNTSPNNDRVRGYKDALLKNNIDIIEDLIVGDSFGEENGYIETKLLLKKKPLPTALFATSNLISLGALRALYEEGLRVPNDISMISFDEQPYSNFLATPMTTIAQESVEIGHLAAKLLVDHIESSKKLEPNGILLPTKLTVRNSVKKITDHNDESKIFNYSIKL